MSTDGLTPELLLASIREQEERRDTALAIYEEATAKLVWLHEGLRILGVEIDEPSRDTNAVVELFPGPEIFEAGVRPTLRQAIVTVMRRDPTAAWRVSDLAVAIVQAGWLADTDEAQKRISDMASVMVADSQLVRVARGTYGLAPELGAAFELRRRRSAKENLPSAELEPQD